MMPSIIFKRALPNPPPGHAMLFLLTSEFIVGSICERFAADLLSQSRNPGLTSVLPPPPIGVAVPLFTLCGVEVLASGFSGRHQAAASWGWRLFRALQAFSKTSLSIPLMFRSAAIFVRAFQ